MTVALLIVASLLAGVVYGSFFEWTLHRYVMHRPFLALTYPYRTHALTHHRIFGSGKDYHLLKHDEHSLITMAWWNGPALLSLNALVGLLAAWLIGSWWILAGFMTALSIYYALYEYLHWCMHRPGPAWIGRRWAFRWIDTHHRLHHLVPDRNLNVVFPIADYVLRTRIARAPAA